MTTDQNLLSLKGIIFFVNIENLTVDYLYTTTRYGQTVYNWMLLSLLKVYELQIKSTTFSPMGNLLFLITSFFKTSTHFLGVLTIRTERFEILMVCSLSCLNGSKFNVIFVLIGHSVIDDFNRFGPSHHLDLSRKTHPLMMQRNISLIKKALACLLKVS